MVAVASWLAFSMFPYKLWFYFFRPRKNVELPFTSTTQPTKQCSSRVYSKQCWVRAEWSDRFTSCSGFSHRASKLVTLFCPVCKCAVNRKFCRNLFNDGNQTLCRAPPVWMNLVYLIWFSSMWSFFYTLVCFAEGVSFWKKCVTFLCGCQGSSSQPGKTTRETIQTLSEDPFWKMVVNVNLVICIVFGIILWIVFRWPFPEVCLCLFTCSL